MRFKLLTLLIIVALAASCYAIPQPFKVGFMPPFITKGNSGLEERTEDRNRTSSEESAANSTTSGNSTVASYTTQSSTKTDQVNRNATQSPIKTDQVNQNTTTYAKPSNHSSTVQPTTTQKLSTSTSEPSTKKASWYWNTHQKSTPGTFWQLMNI